MISHRPRALWLALMLISLFWLGNQPARAQTALPTFSIVSVTRGSSVTVRTANLPANMPFTVRMGPMGTRGVNGTVAAVINSGAGGTQDLTFNIPAAQQNAYRIAIRMEGTQGYFAYNWFYNNTTGGSTPPPASPPSPVMTIPSFHIASVVRDTSVTIQTTNLPPGRDFAVTMGRMGTRGVGGSAAGSINSGEGGSQTFTLAIPAGVHNLSLISIRIQSADGYYAYNWFHNNTATVSAPTGGGTPVVGTTAAQDDSAAGSSDEGTGGAVTGTTDSGTADTGGDDEAGADAGATDADSGDADSVDDADTDDEAGADADADDADTGEDAGDDGDDEDSDGTAQTLPPTSNITVSDRAAWRALLAWPDQYESMFRPMDDNDGGMTFYALSSGKSLVEVVTDRFAYQQSYIYLLADTNANPPTATLISFDTVIIEGDGSLTKRAEPSVVGVPSFDGVADTLTILYKSRGLGDCGEWYRYAIADDGSATIAEMRAQACDYTGDPVLPDGWPVIDLSPLDG